MTHRFLGFVVVGVPTDSACAGSCPLSRPKTSLRLQRRRGSALRHLHAISWNGSGMLSGLAPCAALPSFLPGGVSTATSVAPRDHTSAAGDSPAVPISGASYGLVSRSPGSPVLRRLSVEILSWLSTAMIFVGFT